jgi:hypothetical protein
VYLVIISARNIICELAWRSCTDSVRYSHKSGAIFGLAISLASSIGEEQGGIRFFSFVHMKRLLASVAPRGRGGVKSAPKRMDRIEGT